MRKKPNAAASAPTAMSSNAHEPVIGQCEGCGTKFEFECYDVGHLYNLAHFVDRGLVKPPMLEPSWVGRTKTIPVIPICTCSTSSTWQWYM